jgi:hypothetical protein
MNPTDALGVDPPAVVVVDEWGEVYFSLRATGHDLPEVHDVIDWVRFVAIQCPECEQPEGGWKTLE